MRRRLVCLLLLCATRCASVAQNVTPAAGDTLLMQEVIVKTSVAVRQQGDTVSFKADSFYKDPLASIDAVLKNLPGMTAGPDGKLMFQGKEVTRFLVNGRLYTGDVQSLLQLLPAELIDKIKLTDAYDDADRLAGIKTNASGKWIDLRYRKEFTGTIYSKIVAGYGDKDRYQGNMFNNYASDRCQATWLLNANNTSVSGPPGGNADLKTSLLPGVNSSVGSDAQVSFNTSDKFTFSLSYGVSNTASNLIQQASRSTFVSADSIQSQSDFSSADAGGVEHRWTLRTDYKPARGVEWVSEYGAGYVASSPDRVSSTTSLINNDRSTQFAREARFHENSAAPSLYTSQLWMQQFRKTGRSLLLQAIARYEARYLDGTVRADNFYGNGLQTSVVNNKNETQQDLRTTVNIQYTEPVSSHGLLKLRYSLFRDNSELSRAVSTGNEMMMVTDSLQSRSFLNRNADHQMSLSYHFRGARLHYSAGIDLRYYSIALRASGAVAAPEHFFRTMLLPNASIRYNWSDFTTVTATYSSSLTMPLASQLNPVPDYTDSLYMFKGNSSLRPEINHHIYCGINYMSPDAHKSGWASLYFTATNDKIISQTFATTSSRITMPVNAGHALHASFSADYTQRYSHWQLGVNSAAVWLRFPGIINGNNGYATSTSLQSGVKVTRKENDWLELETACSFRSSIYHPVQGGSVTLQCYTAATTVAVYFPRQFRWSLLGNYVHNIGLAEGLQPDFFQANIQVDKHFGAIKNCSVRLQITDIFNMYPNTSRTIGDNYIEDRSVNRIGRYCLLSLIYRFTSGKGSREPI